MAPGLSQSFTNLLKERGLNFNNSQIETDFEIPGYTLASDGKYYKYNMEVDGIYYCPNNIIIGNGVPREAIPLDRGMVIDHFCIDFKNKEINLADNDDYWDPFLVGLQDIEKIEVEKSENDGKVIKMYLNNKEEPVVIGVDKDNQIIKYENQYLQQVVGYVFLTNNTTLTELNLPKLQQVGDFFLSVNNTALTELNLPKLQQVGGYFLWNNTVLKKLNLPELQQVGHGFLTNNTALTELNLPKLQEVGNTFLSVNTALTKLNLPKLQQVGFNFLCGNTALTELNLPELQQVGDRFLEGNTALKKLNLPKLPELEKLLREKNNLKNITTLDIARLDKESELTTVEVESAKGIIQKIVDYTKKVYKKLTKKEDVDR